MTELPNELKNILCVEDIKNSFKANRYLLSIREKELFENIIRMRKVNKNLMEMGISYLNSTLLYGESGTGKTTFGKYVAYKTGLPFCYLNFSSLIDSHMGGTAKNISKAFEYAIYNQCVFMLDEIDCISIRRSSAGSSVSTDGEMARVTICLIQEFDKLPNDIIVIGATNRLDRVDEALLRRLSVKHEVKTLNREEKIGMVDKYLFDIKMNFTETEIKNLVDKNENQSILLNDLIRMITSKIDIESVAE